MSPTILRAAALLALSAAPALAAEPKLLGTNGDWSAFAADSPKECWAVSQPTKTVNTKDGKPVEVSRGDKAFRVTSQDPLTTSANKKTR